MLRSLTLRMSLLILTAEMNGRTRNKKRKDDEESDVDEGVQHTSESSSTRLRTRSDEGDDEDDDNDDDGDNGEVGDSDSGDSDSGEVGGLLPAHHTSRQRMQTPAIMRPSKSGGSRTHGSGAGDAVRLHQLRVGGDVLLGLQEDDMRQVGALLAR